MRNESLKLQLSQPSSAQVGKTTGIVQLLSGVGCLWVGGVGEVGGRVASTPGRPLDLEEGRPGIDYLRMRGIFRILSSKFDRKLNYLRRACTL